MLIFKNFGIKFRHAIQNQKYEKTLRTSSLRAHTYPSFCAKRQLQLFQMVLGTQLRRHLAQHRSGLRALQRLGTHAWSLL
jgi:hypothetical protein